MQYICIVFICIHNTHVETKPHTHTISNVILKLYSGSCSLCRRASAVASGITSERTHTRPNTAYHVLGKGGELAQWRDFCLRSQPFYFIILCISITSFRQIYTNPLLTLSYHGKVHYLTILIYTSV